MENTPGETATLLASLKAFCFPGGEEAGRGCRSVKTTQRGEFRSAPGARWMTYTAEERIDATQTGFCWDARFGGSRLGSFVVTDAYEQSHGQLSVKLGGVIPVKKFTGPDVDKAEIQRYFSSIVMCPSILLHHPSLEFTAHGANALAVRDRNDLTNATVEMVIGVDGQPSACRTERPRLVGKKTVLTPWLGSCLEFQECEGLRVARRIEVSWRLPEGDFTYLRGEVTSLHLLP